MSRVNKKIEIFHDDLTNLDPDAVNILSEELLQMISKKFMMGVKDESPNWVKCYTPSRNNSLHINIVDELVDYNRY